MAEEKKIYLRIKVDGQTEYLKAFQNDRKTKDSDADYSGKGVLVWLNEAKPKQEETKPVVEIVKPIVQARRF
ncbi:MAG: hypothetical protein PHR77_03235 [Kiritimatiellae bacterium]|nr:hypothetical protein [Kiritimatiellia bacterium]MDD5519571.1 hypothetical protein [Kiritimatiellia bacterium]